MLINNFNINLRYDNYDVILVFDDGVEIKTHKIRRAEHSIFCFAKLYLKYIVNIFAQYLKILKKKNEKRIKLHEISSKIFDIILINLYTLIFNCEDLDLYESIEYLRILDYLNIEYDKNKIILKFSKFAHKYTINELNNIYDLAYFFSDDEKILLFEIIYIRKSYKYDKEELDFIEKHNLKIKDICDICYDRITRDGSKVIDDYEYIHFNCRHNLRKLFMSKNKHHIYH